MGDSGRKNSNDIWLAGVDGCRAGWIVAFVRPAATEFVIRVVERFSDLIAASENPAVIAVDIPIGLPDRSGHGGRAAENAVRPLASRLRGQSHFSSLCGTRITVRRKRA